MHQQPADAEEAAYRPLAAVVLTLRFHLTARQAVATVSNAMPRAQHIVMSSTEILPAVGLSAPTIVTAFKQLCRHSTAPSGPRTLHRDVLLSAAGLHDAC
jgi:hypothetical protein